MTIESIPIQRTGLTLRADPSRVTADYLVFFLNLPATQAVLRQLATGSTIPNLRRSAIEQLALPLPSLSDQHKLVALSRLVRRLRPTLSKLQAHPLFPYNSGVE